ncbi:glycosyltransferase family 39 protein [Rhodococcus sp. IEGM 1307]|uniref:glycosyltransferase family 39 protein n=1 Tax=Rhodococcus sp. IEGM 1307 TaxID=3047091 RepID=UPI0024B7DAAD|nr:glycosyltransferase family 39 protein [Rhodococcus sp. IEGM 1307]MDI9973367.1 glycosyltransferase family 39 protein [Rhodococcus sp. IEGM 1307]
MTAAVALVALFFNLRNIGRPSLWRDEVVTALMAERGPHGIVVLAQNSDTVQAPYYLMMWAWSTLFGTSETSLRAISAIAVAIAVAALFQIAVRYTTTRGALVAATLFLVLPSTTRYAQEVRAQAFILAAIVVATLLLHLALADDRRARWIGYALALTFGALCSFMALMILAGHAALMWRRVPWRTAALAWSPALGVAATMFGLSFWRKNATEWIPPATWPRLKMVGGQLAGTETIALLFVAAVLAFAVWTGFSRQWQAHGWLLIVAALPVTLWLVGHVQNIFVARYVLFVVPFYALIAAMVLTRANVVAALAFLILVSHLAYPEQVKVRGFAGHGDDLRSAQAAVAQQARPGDAIIFDFTAIRAGFDYYNDRSPAPPLADPLNVSPGQEDLKTFGNLSKPCTAAALAGVDRVWDVHVLGSPLIDRTGPRLCGSPLTLVTTTQHGGVLVSLYRS